MSRPKQRSTKRSPVEANLKQRDSFSGPTVRRRLRLGYLAAFATGAAVTSAAFVAVTRFRPNQQAAPVPARNAPSSHYDLLAMSPAELETVDIALMNLLCAKGLPGAEDFDIPAVLAKLDEWADKVKSETQRHLYRATDPKYAAHYAHSEARLRTEFIVQCLQEDCGVHYNLERVRDVDFSKPQDLFIHGMVGSSNGGTCSSMPVLYTAIGRRLGYPIKLVVAKQHVFCRWDDGKERFNIDGAGNGGIDYPSDDFYRTWPHQISDAEMKSDEFLKSLTAQEALANFLLQRACCLQAHRRTPDARACLAEAVLLMPNSTTLNTALMATFNRSVPVQAMQSAARDYSSSLPRQAQPSLPPNPEDPRPKMPMPGVTPTFGFPSKPASGVK